MLDDRRAEDLRRHRDEGWNKADLDTIMAPSAEDVVFSSPFVPTLASDPAKTTIDGYDALGSYVDHALRDYPGIRYALEGTQVGCDTVVLVYSYRSPDGAAGRGADSMRVDATGKVAEWRCRYAR